MPMIATELGQDDCEGDWVKAFMQWLDERGMGYLAWQWNRGACIPEDRATSLYLIQDYESATPSSGYAQTVYDHFWEVAP